MNQSIHAVRVMKRLDAIQHYHPTWMRPLRAEWAAYRLTRSAKQFASSEEAHESAHDKPGRQDISAIGCDGGPKCPTTNPKRRQTTTRPRGGR